MTSRISRSVDVSAPADRVWELVSDLPGMGAYSPENTGGSWQKGVNGPAVGAVFRGKNAQGRRRWSTRSTVVRCVPGREFAFDVSAFGMAVAQWSYDVEPTGRGCTVTETWLDRRGSLVLKSGAVFTGVPDREAFTAQSIEQTLARMKAHAERV